MIIVQTLSQQQRENPSPERDLFLKELRVKLKERKILKEKALRNNSTVPADMIVNGHQFTMGGPSKVAEFVGRQNP